MTLREKMKAANYEAQRKCAHDLDSNLDCATCMLDACVDVAEQMNSAGCIEPHTLGCKSLTRRERFAAMAMQGLLANVRIIETANSGRGKTTAEAAVKMADALIDALATERQPYKE